MGLMKKTSSLIFLAFFVLGIILRIFSSIGFAQTPVTSANAPQPPPVDIVFTAVNTPIAGQELILTLKVTPLEDMHADISCLLPEGVEPIREDGIMVRPYMDRQPHNQEQQIRYRYAIGLWVGPLTANTAKEFTFRVKASDKGNYGLIAHVEALAKWGIKEEPLAINIE